MIPTTRNIGVIYKRQLWPDYYHMMEYVEDCLALVSGYPSFIATVIDLRLLSLNRRKQLEVNIMLNGVLLWFPASIFRATFYQVL